MTCCTSPAQTSTQNTAYPIIEIVSGISPGQKPVTVHYGDRAMMAGFHITEVKHAHIRSMDCAAAVDSWDEVIIQLLDIDGPEDGRMSARKFAAIMAKAGVDIAAPGRTPIVFEIARPGEAMQLHEFAGLQEEQGIVRIATQQRQAVCKPELKTAKNESAACCSDGTVGASGCCG